MVRQLWVELVVREFQVFAGVCLELPPSARRAALDTLCRRLPQPSNPLEQTFLEGLVSSAKRQCTAETCAAQVTTESARLVRRAFDVLDARAPARTEVREIATVLAVHPRTLNRAFHAVCGTGPRSAVRARQFDIAKALVLDMKVDAAAAMMGVSRTAIYRLFRSQAGRTPGELRARRPSAVRLPKV